MFTKPSSQLAETDCTIKSAQCNFYANRVKIKAKGPCRSFDSTLPGSINDGKELQRMSDRVGHSHPDQGAHRLEGAGVSSDDAVDEGGDAVPRLGWYSVIA